MSTALPPEAAAVLALLALALLPGLLVVRAPWTVVPALSVAFWTLSAWWLPVASRDRGLRYALLGFGVLALLRTLPRHQVPPPPDHAGPEPPPLVTGPTTGDVPPLRSVPALAVVAVALALVAPLPLWPHVPGAEMAFHTTSARLVVWRDALPATYEPLFPFGPFGAHAPAIPTLAADLSLISGLDPGRSVALATQLSAGLLLLAVFALFAGRLRPAPAALAALLALAAAPWPGFLGVWGQGGASLALALGLSAAHLLVGHRSRASAAAAGLLLGAALLAQPLLAAVVGLGTVVSLSFRARLSGGAGEGSDAQASSVRSLAARSANGAPRDDASLPGHPADGRSPVGDDVSLVPGTTRRLLLACAVAVVVAAPGLLRLARALSWGEVSGALGTLSATELLRFVTGLGLVALALLLTHWLSASHPRLPVLAVALAAVSALVLLVRVHLGPAAGQLPPGQLRAVAALEGEGRPLEAVCAPAGLIDWVPALGGRPPGDGGREAPGPWIPPFLREEWERSPRRNCSKTLDPAGGTWSQPLTPP